MSLLREQTSVGPLLRLSCPAREGILGSKKENEFEKRRDSSH
jgi:hypothetical protein